MRICWIAVTALALAALTTPAWAEGRGLDRVRTEIWKTLTGRFIDDRTEMIYDVMWKLPDGSISATRLLPTAEEIAVQKPNPCAWGVGLQDCVFNGVPLLLASLQAGDRDRALATYRGLKRCAEVSGVPGFIARGVSPEDGKGYYINSSRDTFTLFVYGMWRLYRHPFADAKTKAEIARLLTDVARYTERCVVAKNGYALLRSDGKPGLVCQMWVADPKIEPIIGSDGWGNYRGLCPHEALRVPMFYAAAHAVSGDAHWREMELRYADDGIRMAEGPVGDNVRGSVLDQMQVSQRLLWECETNQVRKARYAQLLDRCAVMAEKWVFPRMVKKASEKEWSMGEPMEDWRKFPYCPDSWTIGGYVYNVPNHPAPCVEEPFVELAHAVLVQARAVSHRMSPELVSTFVKVVTSIDYSKSVAANVVNALLATYVLQPVVPDGATFAR